MNRYTKESLEEIVKEHKTISDIARAVGIKPGTGGAAYLSRRIKELEIDTSHLVGFQWRINCPEKDNRKKDPREVLILKRGPLRRQKHDILYKNLIKIGMKPICVECGCGEEWNGKKLTLHIDHINGNVMDDRKENLRFLCPNCHTQTKTYCYNKYKINPFLCSDCGKKIRRNKTGKCFKCYVKSITK